MWYGSSVHLKDLFSGQIKYMAFKGGCGPAHNTIRILSVTLLQKYCHKFFTAKQYNRSFSFGFLIEQFFFIVANKPFIWNLVKTSNIISSICKYLPFAEISIIMLEFSKY